MEDKIKCYTNTPCIGDRLAVLAVDDRHVAFCEYNGSVARIICVAVAGYRNDYLPWLYTQPLQPIGGC